MSKLSVTGILSGAAIKYIAMSAMLIDHIALCIPYIWRYHEIYMVMRGIGRIAFPIFCFSLIEGYYHTSDIGRYILRLFIFAVISEIPFDLAVGFGKIVNLSHQNVFFTLCIGLCMVYMFDNELTPMIMKIAVVVAACIIAQALRADYGMFGIVQIFMLYVFRRFRAGRIISVAVLNVYYGQPAGACALLFTELYNGKRGYGFKYFMYAFYPLQFVLLYLVRKYI